VGILVLSQWRKTTVVEKVFYGLMFLSFAFLFWLNSHYFSTCPRAPDSQSGNIYPLDIHGTFVYLTETENSKMLAAQSLFVGAWLSAVGFYVVNWGLKKLKVR
jgi:hypothetical protein